METGVTRRALWTANNVLRFWWPIISSATSETNGIEICPEHHLSWQTNLIFDIKVKYNKCFITPKMPYVLINSDPQKHNDTVKSFRFLVAAIYLCNPPELFYP